MASPSLPWETDGSGLAFPLGDEGSVGPYRVRLTDRKRDRLVLAEGAGNAVALDGASVATGPLWATRTARRNGTGSWWARWPRFRPQPWPDGNRDCMNRWVRCASADGRPVEACLCRPDLVLSPASAPLIWMVHRGPDGGRARRPRRAPHIRRGWCRIAERWPGSQSSESTGALRRHRRAPSGDLTVGSPWHRCKRPAACLGRCQSRPAVAACRSPSLWVEQAPTRQRP